MSRPRPDVLDHAFKVGIMLKGLNGIVESIGGVALLVVSPAVLNQLVVALTREELSEDPNDFIANHLLRTAHGLRGSAVVFGAAYLLSHGAAKITLVAALLRNKLWAYPWMIAFLLAFIGYQLYRIVVGPSAAMIALTIFDVVVLWLTYREYRKVT